MHAAMLEQLVASRPQDIRADPELGHYLYDDYVISIEKRNSYLGFIGIGEESQLFVHDVLAHELGLAEELVGELVAVFVVAHLGDVVLEPAVHRALHELLPQPQLQHPLAIEAHADLVVELTLLLGLAVVLALPLLKKK